MIAFRRLARLSSARFAAALVALGIACAAPSAWATPCNGPQDCPAPSVCNIARHLCVGCIDDSQCRGPAPVCNVSAGFCSACQGDHGSTSALACPAAHPACITSGAHNGECADCSATNTTACGASRPLCNVATSTCGCNTTADCQTSTYCDHDVAPEGRCVFGCKVVGGTDHCPTGSHCDVRDGTIGNCAPGECSFDADCGASDSGRVCSGNACVNGCRGQGGNGCKAPLVCSSGDQRVGQCGIPMPDAGTPTPDASTVDASHDAAADADAPIVAPGLGGCHCEMRGARGDDGALAILGLGLAALMLRKRACATPSSPSSIRK